jgi:hypothetical protein
MIIHQKICSEVAACTALTLLCLNDTVMLFRVTSEENSSCVCIHFVYCVLHCLCRFVCCVLSVVCYFV